MKRVLITGTGRFVPDRIVTNKDLCQYMDTSEDWIKQRTGIEQRYWISDDSGISTSDLGFQASLLALKSAKWSPEDIDLIIFATLSPDIFFPGSGCFLQHKLGLKNTPTLDIRQQCTGFLYGLITAEAYIKSNLANRVLLVCSEIQSTGLDLSTKGRDVAVIFGDGAAAVCVEGVASNKEIGILSSVLHTDGSLAESLMTEAPSSKCNPRLTEEMIKKGRHYPYMDGKVIFKTAVRRLPEVANNVLRKVNLNLTDVDLIIPHQANLRINQTFAKSMKLSSEKIFNNIDQYGNTTAASIPIALDDAIERGLVKEGSLVMFIGLGAGVTWGSVLYQF